MIGATVMSGQCNVIQKHPTMARTLNELWLSVKSNESLSNVTRIMMHCQLLKLKTKRME